jgi:hypothetical protein
MRPEFLLKLLVAAPFEPFRIFISDRRHYDVAHPEAARVAGGVREVTVRPTGFAGPPGQRTAYLSFIHITHVEVYSPKSA